MTDLYQENILDHHKNPRHYGLDKTADAGSHVNPSCGDSVTVQLEVKDGVVADIHWEGDGCAISMASMSLLSEDILGKSIDEIEKIDLAHIQDLLGLDEISPSRQKCAQLGLRAVQVELKK